MKMKLKRNKLNNINIFFQNVLVDGKKMLFIYNDVKSNIMQLITL